MSQPGGRNILRGSDDMCHQIKNICSIPAGGKRANQRNKDVGGGRGGGGVLMRIFGRVVQQISPTLTLFQTKMCNFSVPLFSPQSSSVYIHFQTWFLESIPVFRRSDDEMIWSLLFLNSLIIHEEKTKEITTVKEVWKCDLNYYKIL